MVEASDKLPYTRSQAKAWARATLIDFYQCPLTPLTPDFRVDAEGVGRNVDAYVQMGVNGLVLGGFHSEAWHMTLDDWKYYHRIYARANAGRLPLWTIILDPCVHQALEKMHFVQGLGYVGAEVINPVVQYRADDEIIAWYQYLTDHSDLAVFLYRTPVSGKLLSPELVARLAQIPTIVGVKQGSLNHADSLLLRKLIGGDFVVSDPIEYWFLDDLREGGQTLYGGWDYIVYGKLRHYLREYVDLARAGHWERAREPWLALRPVYDLYQEVFLDEIVHTASYAGAEPIIKAWWGLIGLENGGGRMLPPVPPLPAERQVWLAGRLSDLGVI